MPVNINASTSSGIGITADNSGVIQFQSNGANTVNISATGTLFTTGNLTVSGTGNQSIAGTLQFNSGYGSVATAYGCRAWVSFDGTTATPTIRGSGNVTSITDGGVGIYGVNFTTAMPDVNYAFSGNGGAMTGGGTGDTVIASTTSVVTTSVSFIVEGDAGTARDPSAVFAKVFR